MYPNRVIIADDSETFPEDVEGRLRSLGDVEILRMPFNSGISAGRNLLVRSCPTKLFVYLDDDVLPVEGAVDKFLSLYDHLERPALVGGVFPLDTIEDERRDFYGYFTLEEGRIVANFLPNADRATIFEEHQGVRYAECRFTHNYFLGDRDVFLENRITWAEQLKYREHLEFFTRFPAWLKIYMSPDIRASHYPDFTEEYYKALRKTNQHSSTMYFATINQGEYEYTKRFNADFDWRSMAYPNIKGLL